MNEVMPFVFPDGGEVRGVWIDGESWVEAAGVNAILGICHPTNLWRTIQRHLDADEYRVIEEGALRPIGRSGGEVAGGERIVLSESGVFAFVLRSSKPQARAFRKWVTSEVLPTLRKTGEFKGWPWYPGARTIRPGLRGEALTAWRSRPFGERVEHVFAQFRPGELGSEEAELAAFENGVRRD